MNRQKSRLASKFISYFLLFLILISSLSSISVFAASIPQPPGNSNGGSNSSPQDYLYLLYKNCQNLPDSGNGFTNTACANYQNNLNSNLNCSDNMFEEENVTGANGVVNKRWFINESNYKDCLDKVGNALSQLNSALCQNIQVNSNGWGPCASNSDSYQNELSGSIGCSGTMYDKNQSTGVYSLNFQKYQACQKTYNTLQGYHLTIVNSSGQVTSDPTAIGSYSGSGGSSSNNGNSDELDVQCEASGFALSWIFCKIIDGAAGGLDWIYSNFIQPLLVANKVPISNSKNDPTFNIWSNFRIYGDIFLVICVLVIIIAESVGGGVFEAYTVRKALPRLLLAAILINLSIYIVAFLVDITNIIGTGIGALIQEPFNSQNTHAYTLHVNGVVGTAGGAAVIAGIVATVFGFVLKAGATASLFSAGLMYFLTAFLIPAFFVFLAIVATLVFRQGLILFLLFVSPVAFALYCLPNTERYFRQWWDLLFRTLLIYPIVAILFALGNILSITISNGGMDSGLASPLASLVGLIALFAPLFLIPFSFSIAGGVLGRAHQLASQGTRRVSEGIQGDKQDPLSLRNRQKAKYDRARIGAREAGYNSAIGKRLARTPGIGGIVSRRGHRAEQLASIYGDRALQNEAIKPVANDEYALRAVMNYGSYQQAAKVDKAAADRWRATGLGWSTSSKMAAYQAAIADRTVFKDVKDEMSTVANIAGTNDDLRERLQGTGFAGNKAANRFDLASTYGIRNDLAKRIANGEKIEDWEFDNAAVEGLRSTSNTQLSQMNNFGAQNGTAAMAREIERQQSIINNTSSTPDAQNTARTRVSEIVAKAQNMESTGVYMPEAIISTLHQGVLQPASRNISDIQNKYRTIQAEDLKLRQATQLVQEAREVFAADPNSPIKQSRLETAQRDFNSQQKRLKDITKLYENDVREYGQQRQAGMSGYDPRSSGGPLDPTAGGGGPSGGPGTGGPAQS